MYVNWTHANLLRIKFCIKKKIPIEDRPLLKNFEKFIQAYRFFF